MQQSDSGEDLLWDLSDAQKWKAIFTGAALDSLSKNPEDLRSDSDERMAANACNLTDRDNVKKSVCGPGWPFRNCQMPKPWSEPLTVSKKRYLRFCKNGYRLHRSYKCDMEYYHPYERSDGLVMKFIVFQNRRKTVSFEIKKKHEILS